jgi:hypothetical protein
MAGGLRDFFGDDWENTLDSLKSAPGAIGGVMLSALRQLRPIDVVAFSFVVAGWAWIIASFVAPGIDQEAWHIWLGMLPTMLWIAAGVAGALIFEIGGLGVRTLAYWESYVLIFVFSIFGVLSLRVALGVNSRQIHRGPSGLAT